MQNNLACRCKIVEVRLKCQVFYTTLIGLLFYGHQISCWTLEY